MKREDETAILVPGGRDATVERIAELWRERMEARGSEPGFRLSISVPTNADVNAIGSAIRRRLREIGQLGEDRVIVPPRCAVKKPNLRWLSVIGSGSSIAFTLGHVRFWPATATSSKFVNCHAEGHGCAQ